MYSFPRPARARCRDEPCVALRELRPRLGSEGSCSNECCPIAMLLAGRGARRELPGRAEEQSMSILFKFFRTETHNVLDPDRQTRLDAPLLAHRHL